MGIDRLKLEVILNAIDNLTRPMKAGKEESRKLAAQIKATQTEIKRLNETQTALQARLQRGELPTRAMARAMQDVADKTLHANNALRDQQARLDALSARQRRMAAIAASTANLNATRSKLSSAGTSMMMAGGVMMGATAVPVAAYAQAEDAATGLKTAMMNARGEVDSTFAAINALATRLGDKLPGTTADFQNMMTMLIRQGMSSKAILGGLGEATAYLAVQLKMPTDQAAEFASKMQDATRTSEKDMMGLMDIIQKGFYLGVDQNNMLQAFSKLSPALDILKKKGIESSQALAPLVVMADQMGMAGEASGNAYRKVFQMSMNASKVHKASGTAGVNLDFTNGKGEFGGIDKMFAQLEKLKGLTTQKRLSVIKTIFGDDAETLSVVSMMIDKGANGYQEVQQKMAAQASLQLRVNAQLATLKNLWDAASGTMTNALAAFGAAIAPDLKALVNWIGDVAGKMREWSDANPELSKWLMRIVAGGGALVALLGALAVGAAAILAPFTMVTSAMAGFSTVAGLVSGGITLISGAFATLAANPVVLAIAAIIVAIAGAAYLIYKYWEPIKAFFLRVWTAIDGIFEKYPILNYIFPIVGIARALIHNWEAVKGFFVGLWNQVTQAFDGGINGISQLFLNWSPWGLVYAAFQKVLSYLGIELPEKFTDFGTMMLQGLMDGITNGLASVKQCIESAGDSVVGWFKDKLGIHSPSTVFAELGAFTMAGLDDGLRAAQDGPLGTVMAFGQRIIEAGEKAVKAFGHQAVAAVAPIVSGGSAVAGAGAGGGGNVFHIYAAPGMDEKALASLVAQKVEEAQRAAAARDRARLSDR